MTNDVLAVIKRRRSIRAYLPQQVEKEKVEAIVEAGLYAPNGGGEAWHFVVVRNADRLEQLNRLAKQYASTCGLPWLESLGKDESFHSIYHAPTVILVSSDPNSYTAEADTSAATENILLAAESLDVGSCWGYFVTQAFQTEEGKTIAKEMGIPDGHRVYTSVMLGYKTEETPPATERKPNLITYVE